MTLATNGLGSTYPNPLVGCVIVHNGRIIGEGWHRQAGLPHAEVNAIKSVPDRSLLEKSTLFVNLEPCSHHGKTPPCADLIIRHKIPKVVIGCRDPFEEVAGRGIEKLKDAGCEVITGVLEAACRDLNKRFITFHEKKRPYIILKWAQTQDGFIAPEDQPDGKPVWISNTYSRQLVHKWRAEEHAVLVGTNTVAADNPSLTVRGWTGQNPVRVVLDLNNRLDHGFNVFNNEAKTIIIKQETLPPPAGKGLIRQICDLLCQNNIQSVIIEGGTKTLQGFIDGGLWDEARVFNGSGSFGKGIPAPGIMTPVNKEIRIENDVLQYITPSPRLRSFSEVILRRRSSG